MKGENELEGSMRAAPDRAATRSRLLGAWLLAAGLLLGSVGAVEAHRLGESYLYLQVYEDTLTGRFEIALLDLNLGLGLIGTPQEITAENLDQRVGFLESYLKEHVAISSPQGPLALRFMGEQDILQANGGYVLLPLEFDGLQGVPETLTFDYSVLFDRVSSHKGFVLVEHNWSTGTFANENVVSLSFGPDSRRHQLTITTSQKLQGFLTVVRLGLGYLREGVDHVLFVLALLLAVMLRRENGRWQPVERLGPALIHAAKVVAAFVAACALPFILAALGVLDLPNGLLEVVVAVSVAAAAANLLWPILRGRLWWAMLGFFGVFHGFSLAAAARKMGVLHEHPTLASLAFVLGVAIGMALLAAVLVPLLYLVRRWWLYRRVGLPVAAVGMLLIAGAWIVERAFGVDIPIRELAYPILDRLPW